MNRKKARFAYGSIYSDKGPFCNQFNLMVYHYNQVYINFSANFNDIRKTVLIFRLEKRKSQEDYNKT